MSVTWLAIDLHTNKKGGRSRRPGPHPDFLRGGRLALAYDRAAYLLRRSSLEIVEQFLCRRTSSFIGGSSLMGALKRSWAPMVKRASMDGRRNIPNYYRRHSNFRLALARKLICLP